MKTIIEAIKFVLKRSFKASPLLFTVFVIANVLMAFTTIVNIFIFKEIIDSANHSATFLGLAIVA